MKHIIILLLTVITCANAFGWEPRNAPQPEERALIAAVIIAEAGGEGKIGMEAVYEVIWQRAALAHSNYTDVVTKPKHFSCLNGVKPSKLIKRMSKHKHYEWVRLGLLFFPPTTIHTVPDGHEKVVRNRADHYFALKGMPKIDDVHTPPSWSKAYDPVYEDNTLKKGKIIEWKLNSNGKVIGNHTFEKHSK
tara:strand:+ start:2734 stop:3306 length:573 start_codon:yes stop_codon:yes gene_type:complete